MSTSTGAAVTRLPLSQSLGSGPDEIVLKLAQDYYVEDVRFSVLVDGKQVGGIYSVSSINGSGVTDSLTLRGDWGSGQHKVEIQYINGHYNPVTGEDSNLALLGATFNGTDFISKPLTLWASGQYNFATDPTSAIAGSSASNYLNGTKGRDILTGGRGNDAFWGGGGQDIYVENRGDGYDTITDFSATGTSADVLRVSGFMVSSFADLSQRIVQVGKDTEVRLGGHDTVLLKNVTASSLTAANFEILNPLAKKAAVSLAAGTGEDTLTIKLSQDYFVGADAKYTVSVDGVQIGGVFSASAVRFTGMNDTLTLKGNWADGRHTVTVNFLNDAFDALTQEDRNLFIESATINGENISGISKLIGSGSHSFAAVVAAAVVVTPAPGGGGGEVPAPTHEVFRYAKGEGVKTIANFDVSGAGSDMLRIDGYGLLNQKAAGGATSLASFEDLKPLLSQVGSDTVVKLSATDSITLKNVTASSLTDANFAIVSKLEGAMQAATNNGWIVFNNTWGSGDFTYGSQYTVSSTYDSEAMATGTTFSWKYPAQNPYSYTKVLAYPSVMFGYDTFDNVKGEFDPAHVLPVQIDDLKSFTTTYDVTQGGDTNGFDTSYDIWLTNKPNGIWSDITNEVMIWLHRGEMGTYGDLVGTYSDGNYSAKIYHTGTYTALVPDKDYLAGSIDVKSILSKLQALGIVSDKEYVNQIDLGSEPFRGSGYLTINSLSFDVESRDDAGIVTKSHADGGATSIVKQGTAGADVISAGTAEIATLIGSAGNDTFAFKKGETGDHVTVQDFHAFRDAAGEHDVLKFTGYGAGASLVHDGGDAWSIHYQNGIEHITLTGVGALTTNDYFFV